MSHIIISSRRDRLEQARQAEANALAYMIVAIVALLLSIVLVGWAVLA